MGWVQKAAADDDVEISELTEDDPAVAKASDAGEVRSRARAGDLSQPIRWSDNHNIVLFSHKVCLARDTHDQLLCVAIIKPRISKMLRQCERQEGHCTEL